jgi:quercetin dioxygenase-like cupin family protein
MYIASGRITYTTPDGTNYDLKAGDFVQIDAGTSIKVKSEEDSAGFFIMLQ